jgi:hypothetical protein
MELLWAQKVLLAWKLIDDLGEKIPDESCFFC